MTAFLKIHLNNANAGYLRCSYVQQLTAFVEIRLRLGPTKNPLLGYLCSPAYWEERLTAQISNSRELTKQFKLYLYVGTLCTHQNT